jgi:hypothetical protein
VSDPCCDEIVNDCYSDAIVIVTDEQLAPPASAQSGSAIITRYTAGAAIGGHRAVWVDASGAVVYADRTDLTFPLRVIGISLNAAALGGNVDVQSHGQVTEAGWNWTPLQEIFLDTAGLLTQTPPTSGFNLVLGFATAPTKMFVDVQEPILLI